MSDRLLGVVLAAVFAPALAGLAGVWASQESYSHGFLVPVFAWLAARPLTGTLSRTGPDERGLIVVFGALVLYAAGLLAGSITLQGLALVTAVAGLVVRRFGPTGLGRLAFPVGFLLFAVPLPAGWLSAATLELQSLVTDGSAALVAALGTPVERHGNVLGLPGGEQLFVAEACSGITSILTLLALGAAIAYFTQPRWSTRLLLMLAVPPLAVGANLLRVVATVLSVDRFGPELVVDSPLHDLAGVAAFVLACLGLLALSRRLTPRSSAGARASAP